VRARARAPARLRIFRGGPARSADQAVGRGGNICGDSGYGKEPAADDCPNIARARENQRLRIEVRLIHSEARGCYDSPRVHCQILGVICIIRALGMTSHGNQLTRNSNPTVGIVPPRAPSSTHPRIHALERVTSDG
jgi:hypothetical protein